MRRPTLICLTILLALAAVPLLLGGGPGGSRDGERRLIIVTPHVQQIRLEFARAFRDWHARRYPADPPVWIDFRSPGGTSEIIRLLQAQYNAAIAGGRIAPDGSCEPGTIGYDIMFGGGTYDHGRLAAGEGVSVPGSEGGDERTPLPMSVPAGFSPREMAAWFPVDKVGTVALYEPDQRWIGTALSSFGIVYNRPLVQRVLGKPDIETFDDLADPRMFGWVAMADPRQSGSISTTLDAILSKYGWDEGWKLLRRIAANSRTFVASSARPPLDVSQGEAAAALAIDFYGRSQQQAILEPGQSPGQSRVGYVDPPGSVSIDPDPVSILRGGPDSELSRRFVEFTLSPEGQALWNLRSLKTLEADPSLPRNPVAEDGTPLGPAEYELRRLPILPAIYGVGNRHPPPVAALSDGGRAGWGALESPASPVLLTPLPNLQVAAPSPPFTLEHLIDQVNPYAIAIDAAPRGWRSAIGPMMGAFAIDSAEQCRDAWQALIRVKADPAAPLSLIANMEARFDAMPTGPQVRAIYDRIFGIPRPDPAAWPTGDDGQPIPAPQAFPDLAPWDAFQDFNPDSFRAVRNTWRNARWASRLKVCYTQAFRENYEAVVEMERKWREESP